MFLILAIFHIFITFFTHQASARSVIFKLFVDFESKIWTTPCTSSVTVRLLIHETCRERGTRTVELDDDTRPRQINGTSPKPNDRTRRGPLPLIRTFWRSSRQTPLGASGACAPLQSSSNSSSENSLYSMRAISVSASIKMSVCRYHTNSCTISPVLTCARRAATRYRHRKNSR